jgi:hypothetical protein
MTLFRPYQITVLNVNINEGTMRASVCCSGDKTAEETNVEMRHAAIIVHRSRSRFGCHIDTGTLRGIFLIIVDQTLW